MMSTEVSRRMTDPSPFLRILGVVNAPPDKTYGSVLLLTTMMLGEGKPGMLTFPFVASSVNSAPKPSLYVDGSPVSLSIQFCVELSQSVLIAAVQRNPGTAVIFRSIE